MTRQSGALIGLTAIVSFLLGLVAAGTRLPPPPGAAVIRPRTEAPLALASTATPPAPAPAAGGPAVDFSAVAAQVNAAVVTVEVASRGEDSTLAAHGYSSDDPNGPHEASGSGFIIDRAGFILTNDHVIAGADRVTVTLADGRAFRAEVVGADPAIDVALLRVHSHDALPVAPLGNSDALRVGEWVCVIGNPLGVYVHSVTVGVVSFLGRKLKLFDQGLDAYIQTDAAISFGNSGGPLVNTRGEVVGIATAISAEAMRIGFAIPIAQVTGVLDQLRERGTVARGSLGVGLTSVTPELRQALRLRPEHGAVVQDVARDTPAERAGLRTYDVVTAIDGHPMRSDEELLRYVSGRAPGSVATLDVWRDGTTRSVEIKLAVREVPTVGRPARRGDVRGVSQAQSPLGIAVSDLDPDQAARLHIPDSVAGVLVSDVDTAGPARLAQVRMTNVIVEINRRPVHSVAEYRSMVSALKPGDSVALLVFDRTTSKRSILTVLTDP